MPLPLAAAVYVALFLLICDVNGPAAAYLDPGTGSIVIQAVLAAIVSVLSVVRIYWSRIKSLFVKSEKPDNALIGD